MRKTTSLFTVPVVAASLLGGFCLTGVEAQQIDDRISSVADREIARRQNMADTADSSIRTGDQLMAERDFEGALTEYKRAYDWLPPSVATDHIRNTALDRFSKAAMALAEQRVREGRYEDARILSQMILDEEYNPGYRPAVVLLSRLEDPSYFNQTVTPGFISNVEQVKQFLNEAQGFYDSARWDMAMKRTDQVLNIDPYNVAARRIQEQINNQKIQYGNEAYSERRSRSIWEVQRAWESPVRQYGVRDSALITQMPSTMEGTARLNRKLDQIIVPSINFRDATVREAISFLQQKSVELDTMEPDPNSRGVNIVLKADGSGGAAPPPSDEFGIAAPAADAGSADTRITLSLTQVPLGEALRYVANLAGLKVKVEPFAVAIVPLSEPTDVLVTKTYRVPPGFIPRSASADTGGGGSLLGGGATVTTGGRGANAREFLEANGVTFPPDAIAQFLPASSQLIVRNTQENIDLIDVLVDSANVEIPTQVEIESKFVEITQNNLKELSFDWLLGAFNVGGDRVFGSGGTPGTSPGLNSADWPFVPPGFDTPVGQFPVTAGNRSGNVAVSANAIDALLFGVTGSSSAAPGIFGLSGIFTDPQFQVVIRALNQQKGVDLLSAPKVTTQSDFEATIEVIREFIYPQEYDPPQIPQTFGGGGGSGTTEINTFPVTPATPRDFTMRPTGVSLRVTPQVGSDGYTINLRLNPEVVEFEGFVNYGSPISTISTDSIIGGGIAGGLIQRSAPVVITPNIINQPIFSTRRVETIVNIWDGQTVSLGGLMREDIQKVDDKVPLLGDLPLVGRAFRSTVDQHLKRNLIIFVTARLIDPAGQPIAMQEEDDEIVDPTIGPDSFYSAPPELPIYRK